MQCLAAVVQSSSVQLIHRISCHVFFFFFVKDVAVVIVRTHAKLQTLLRRQRRHSTSQSPRRHHSAGCPKNKGHIRAAKCYSNVTLEDYTSKRSRREIHKSRFRGGEWKRRDGRNEPPGRHSRDEYIVCGHGRHSFSRGA